MLSAAERAATVDTIAAVQCPDGMIPWWVGGHADPWNLVEAAMALSAGGRRQEAERAYAWLAANQRPDGAWHQYYRARPGGGTPLVEVALLDANVTAYVAAGVWHHYLATGDAGFLEAMWPVVAGAMEFVLRLQRPGGEVVWARHPDGTPWSFALLTASSSTCFSLGCGLAAARVLGLERPHWQRAWGALAAAIADRPENFLPKDRWAMDWYYPVLAGVVTGGDARVRLAGGWDRFVIEGWGVRCVADRRWVTAAETCEAAIAHLVAGQREEARRLFGWVARLRASDGSYFTGVVQPDGVHFPAEERATYSAAAVTLAADALVGSSPASGLFAGQLGVVVGGAGVKGSVGGSGTGPE